MKRVNIAYPKSFIEYTEKIDPDCWGAKYSSCQDHNFLLEANQEQYVTFYTGRFYGYGAMKEILFHKDKQIVKSQYVPKYFVRNEDGSEVS